MVMVPIYGKWQNDQNMHFISLLVVHQSEFPLANRFLSSNGASLWCESGVGRYFCAVAKSAGQNLNTPNKPRIWVKRNQLSN